MYTAGGEELGDVSRALHDRSVAQTSPNTYSLPQLLEDFEADLRLKMGRLSSARRPSPVRLAAVYTSWLFMLHIYTIHI
jgi:hypothetical protein